MNQKIKAVFFDIDGTLVSFNTHLVPESTRQAVAALRNQGIKVFIASGRHIASINNLPDMEFDGYVTINGTIATVLRDGRQEVVYRHPIPQADIHSWLDYLDSEPRSTVMVMEDGLLMNFRSEEMNQIFELLNFPAPPEGDLRSVSDRTVYQIITTFTDADEPRVMTHLPHCKTTRWHPLFTDIIERSGSKAHGIEALINHLGYDRTEIMAFGDGGNDIEMLTFAGQSIAMGNAPEAVQAVADYVTDTVDADGVLKALRHYGML